VAEVRTEFRDLRPKLAYHLLQWLRVRSIFAFLIVALVSGVMAGPAPLSNKEIALMLRSGYSSDAVLTEITQRRVLEPLDEATKKSLLGFGAKPELISALENKSCLVSTNEAEQARAREAEIAARRATQIEQDRQFNTLLQARAAEAARARPATSTRSPNETPMLAALKGKLVRCQNGTVVRADGGELENKKFVGLYYSAHWCGPCRKFTPQLVEYYKRVKAAHPEFELIFVSADRSRFGWETYIRETKMPWLAVDYEQIRNVTGLQQLGGSSIPSLLVLDQDSRMVASTYQGDKYLGPQNALDALEKIFAAGGRVAQAP
jgi:nucleoredoxin